MRALGNSAAWRWLDTLQNERKLIINDIDTFLDESIEFRDIFSEELDFQACGTELYALH